jgi:hypothetical protein
MCTMEKTILNYIDVNVVYRINIRPKQVSFMILRHINYRSTNILLF